MADVRLVRRATLQYLAQPVSFAEHSAPEASVRGGEAAAKKVVVDEPLHRVLHQVAHGASGKPRTAFASRRRTVDHDEQPDIFSGGSKLLRVTGRAT